jgi:ubiquinone/menaquinone biosynthesis C-methylase UbiE
MNKSADKKVLHEWEDLYNQPGQSHKNRYPDGDIIRFVMRNFSSGERKNIRILDLGCGWGNNLRFLCDEGFEAWGIDGSAKACHHCLTISPNVLLGNLTHLPFADEFFDAAIDRNSIQCNTIDAVQAIVQEAHRVLKPGGLLHSIILAQTNQPERFHAHYLTSPKSKLSRKAVERIFAPFSSLEIDYDQRTYEGGQLCLYQWHITGRKGTSSP